MSGNDSIDDNESEPTSEQEITEEIGIVEIEPDEEAPVLLVSDEQPVKRNKVVLSLGILALLISFFAVGILVSKWNSDNGSDQAAELKEGNSKTKSTDPETPLISDKDSDKNNSETTDTTDEDKTSTSESSTTDSTEQETTTTPSLTTTTEKETTTTEKQTTTTKKETTTTEKQTTTTKKETTTTTTRETTTTRDTTTTTSKPEKVIVRGILTESFTDCQSYLFLNKNGDIVRKEASCDGGSWIRVDGRKIRTSSGRSSSNDFYDKHKAHILPGTKVTVKAEFMNSNSKKLWLNCNDCYYWQVKEQN